MNISDERIVYEYNKNTDFKHYVDGYCKTHGISVEVALTHKLVRTAEQYYKSKTNIETKENNA